MVGCKEVLRGFVHIDADGVFILKAEGHVEYTEVIVDSLNSDEELLLLDPTARYGALVVSAGRKFRAYLVGVSLLGEESELVLTDSEC